MHIYIAIPGEPLRPFEPRAHPEPYTVTYTRRERRRHARHGRRYPVRVPRERRMEAELPRTLTVPIYMRRGQSYALRFATLHARRYHTAVTSRCPWYGRGPDCGMRGMRDMEHEVQIEVVVYAQDGDDRADELAAIGRRLIREEQRKLAALHEAMDRR